MTLLVGFSSSLVAADIDVGGTISAQTTWTSDNVYRVTSSITVNPGVILTIQAGTVIKFNPGTQLQVQGALDAAGNASEKIVFTSYRDDEFGGDTNGDGPSSGAPGDWYRLYFTTTVTASLTQFEHCIVRYGGSSNGGLVYLDAAVDVRESEISRSNTYGLYTSKSSVIENNVIEDHASYGIYNSVQPAQILGNTVSGCQGWAIYTNQCSPVIDGNTVTNNASIGIICQSSGTHYPEVRNNVVTDNASVGIYMYRTGGNGTLGTIEDNTVTGCSWGIYYNYQSANAPVVAGNTLTGNLLAMQVPASAVPNASDLNVVGPNDRPGIWILGNTRSTDLTLTKLYAGEVHEVNRYYVSGTWTMAAGAKLTVEPGVAVKFATNSGLTIHGALDVNGTASEKVVFTSYADDTAGGDMNADGTATQPTHGSWYSIYLSNQATDAECEIDHAEIRYGGAQNNASLYVYQCDFPVKLCKRVSAMDAIR